MPLNYTPTTELEAVNTMLTAIGEAPVNQLDDQLLSDVSIARKILHENSRDLQTSEWHFNTEENYELSPDNYGELPVPGNALRVSIDTNMYPTRKITQRGNKMYDLDNHTYQFSESVIVKILFFLPFAQLPEAARRYIAIKSARVFQDRTVGSDTLHTYTNYDEQWAWAKLREAEADTGKYNIMNNPFTRKIIMRR